MSLGNFNYFPAVLRHQPSHGWSVEYYVMDGLGVMRRKVIRMNSLRKRFGKTSEFKVYCNQVVCSINARLAGGWTPFGSEQNTRLYTPLEMVVGDYLKEKEGELRPDSMRSYRSFCKCLLAWVSETCPGVQCSGFNKVLAVRFMDHIQNDLGLSGRTYNNRLKSARAVFSWAVSKCYAKENPFEGLKTKRELPKKRVPVPPDVRARVTAWCVANAPNYSVLCRLVFDSLIRPREAWRLRISDLHLSDGYIWIGEEISKTHHGRMASLTPDLIRDLAVMVEGFPASMYLFGPGFKPGVKHIRYQNFRELWERMRDDLGLPKEMQLYSLRDTGFNEMIKGGIDPLTVMQHADHHDLTMTTRYANHVDPKLVETISQNAPEF